MTLRPIRTVLFQSIILLSTLWIIPKALASSVTIVLSDTSPQVTFSLEYLNQSLKGKGHRVKRVNLTPLEKVKGEIRIVLTLQNNNTVDSLSSAPVDLGEEAFSIRKPGADIIWVVGADPAGLMYGTLDLAETIEIGDLEAVKDADQAPYMPLRGTKFNIPLDVRTPSYTDVCDAGQQNIIEMWNFDFWSEYIDNLARHRYNYISLWSLHPFPSLVKVPDYEDVALEDVQRSTVDWEEAYSLNGVGFDAPEILNNVETLKIISIDEKIAFWRRVMRYAKERNIDFYIVTWNIFVNGTGGKYGITDKIDNPITRDYFRKSVKEVLLTYPDLKGIGLTTGENMEGAGFQEKEDWAFETYGQGVLDAVKEQPGRKVTFIHRQHQAGASDIAKRFKPLVEHEDIEFIFSFKYAKAHVFSSTIQPYHTQGFVQDIGDLKTVWTLRNDDSYMFRWGGPDFVREFISNIPYEISRGFYYGSDQYIWGREFLSKEPETPRKLEVAKHWYHWLLWGRLGYDPTLSNDRLKGILKIVYPNVHIHKFFDAWQEASMIYPVTTGFHWGSLDFQWYIEGNKSTPNYANTPTGYNDVNRFVSLPPHPSTDNVSIPNYTEAVLKGLPFNGTTPVEVSQKLHAHADKALDLLSELSHGGHKELRQTLTDIETIANLGKFYAHKIRGATELTLFRKTGRMAHQTAAVRELNEMVHYWRTYSALALSQYENPLWTNRVGHVNFKELMRASVYDVTIAGGEPDVRSMVSRSNGTILEAEEADINGYKIESSLADHSGKGYLERAQGYHPKVTFTYNAPYSGIYHLEFRYAQATQHISSVPMEVNGKYHSDFSFWLSGSKNTWVWDRVPVKLKRGRNSIAISPHRRILLDHLKVIPTR